MSSSLFAFDPSDARRAVGADHLDHDFAFLCPDEMRLPCGLSPDTPGWHPLHGAFVELLAITHVERARQEGDNPLVRMEVRCNFGTRLKPGAIDVDPRLLFIANKVGASVSGWPHLPFEFIGGDARGHERVGADGRRDECKEEYGRARNTAKIHVSLRLCCDEFKPL